MAARSRRLPSIKGLTLSVDYYHVTTTKDIFRVAAQTMVDDLNNKGSASIWQPYFSKADGSQITTTAVNQRVDAERGLLPRDDHQGHLPRGRPDYGGRSEQ